MCKHCERLVRDKEEAPKVHSFFEMLARKTTEKMRADGFTNTVTADDIEIIVNVTGLSRSADSFSESQVAMLRWLDELGSGK